jgi:hypothetical protein
MRHKRWIALAILPALLLAGDFFYWRLAVNQLRAGFEAWIVQAKAAGWTVRHGAVTAGGWPDSARLRVANVTVAASGIFGRDGLTLGSLHLDSVDWGADAIVLRAGLTRPGTLDVTPIGPHPLRLNNGPPNPVSAEHLHLRLTSRLNAPPRAVDVDATALSISIPARGVLNVGHLSGHADLKPDAGRDQAVVKFSVEAQPVTLPDGVHFGLGPEISEVGFDGVLNGPWPPHRNDPQPDLAARVTAWRDAGGSLEVRRLAIGWGEARLDATATLALDEDLQPMGAGTGKIVGYGAALDALAADAVLTRSAATAANAVLSLLADTPADDQPRQVEVPLTLQFRTLSVRQVPLIRLPELDWPGHQAGGPGVLSR